MDERFCSPFDDVPPITSFMMSGKKENGNIRHRKGEKYSKKRSKDEKTVGDA
ncbi:unnamed protein product, partial [Nesidiocoris tenuis]